MPSQDEPYRPIFLWQNVTEGAMPNEIESDTSVLKSPDSAVHDQTKKSKKLWKRIWEKKAENISKVNE
jgi:hypothetical protein